MGKRGQASVEYIVIIGFAMLLLLPLIWIYQQESNHMKDDLIKNQVRHFSQQIVDNAETVYYMGKPTKTTLKVYVPYEVRKIVINDTYNYIDCHTSLADKHAGLTVLSVYSHVNISGPDIVGMSGTLYFEVEATDTGVNISLA